MKTHDTTAVGGFFCLCHTKGSNKGASHTRLGPLTILKWVWSYDLACYSYTI